MENSLKIQLSSIEDIKKSVEALQFMVDTDWNKELQQIYPGYYTDWISTLKQDIWAKINTTDLLKKTLTRLKEKTQSFCGHCFTISFSKSHQRIRKESIK